MIALLAALLLQTAAAAPRPPLRLEIVPPITPKTDVRLLVTDRFGKVLSDQTVTFLAGSAAPHLAPDAIFVQALGPAVFSERTFIGAGGRVELRGLPTGLVRITGVESPREVRPRVFATDILADQRGARLWEVVEAAHGVSDGVPWSSFRVPAGRYALAVDRGLTQPVLIASAEVLASREAAAAVRAPENRRLSVRAIDGAKSPVKGARLEGATYETSDRAVAALLERRAAPAKADGVLDFGPVPAESPMTIRVAAPGFRTGTLGLGARFEEGRRDVALAANPDVEVRVTGLAGRRGEARAEVALARCRNQQQKGASCFAETPRRVPLDGESRARFSRVDLGAYQLDVSTASGASTRQPIEVAGDTDTVVVEMAVGEWTFRGTTRIHGGGPVEAHVTAMEFVDHHGTGTAAETRSAADGTFEIKVVSTAGHGIALGAESADPKAQTQVGNTLDLSEEKRTIEGVDLELDATGLEITVRDARSRAPLPGCPVSLTWDADSNTASSSMTLNADGDGKVTKYALAGGIVRVAVNCDGHYRKDLDRVEVVRDAVKRVEALVEPSQDIVLAVTDERSAPVAGATVMVLASPFSYFTGVGRFGAVPAVGTTDSEGELRLRGDRYGGLPVFVIAAGAALGVDTLPAPASCDRAEDCRLAVRLLPPPAFAGLDIRQESGRPAVRRRYSLTRNGVPIPYPVLDALEAANGLPPAVPASPVEFRAAALLPEGTYTLTTVHVKAGEGEKKGTWAVESVGTFRVPSLERVDLLDRDGVAPKPPDARTKNVAER